MSKPKKPREKSKTREWERERRNRLNEYFKKLWEVLPVYDASAPLSKPEILIQAAATIREIDEKLKSLLTNSANEKAEEKKLKVASEVLKRTQDRVKKLLVRNAQLTNLLSMAGIKVPSECGRVKKFRKSLKYDNVVTPQQAATIQIDFEKENQHKSSPSKKGRGKSRKKPKKKIFTAQNCIFLVSQPSATNLIVSKPTVAQKVPFALANINKSAPFANPSPCTFVFANGTIMSVVSGPRSFPIIPTVLANTQPLSCPTLIVISSSDIAKTADVLSSAKKGTSLPFLKPKCGVTMTTQVNKVPIPALSSKFNKYICSANKRVEIRKETGRSKECSKKKSNCGDSKKKNETINSGGQEGTSRSEDKLVAAKTGEQASEEVEQTNEKDNSTDEPQSTNKESSEKEPITCNSNEISVAPLIETDLRKHSFTTASSDAPLLQTSNHLEPIVTASTEAAQLTTPQKSVKQQETQILELSSTNTCLNQLPIPTNHSDLPSCDKQSKASFDLSGLDSQNDLKSLDTNLVQTELSNDIFASFQVPPGCQNPESTSPTAAFLLAFPLVSSGLKVTEVMGDENTESQAGTPNLLQIGTMDISKTTQSYNDHFTNNLLNLDSFSFFTGGKEPSGGGFYNTKEEGPSKQPVADINANSYKTRNHSNEKSGISTKFASCNAIAPVTLSSCAANANAAYNPFDISNDVFFKPNDKYLPSGKQSNSGSSVRPPNSHNNVFNFPDLAYKTVNNATTTTNQFASHKPFHTIYTSASVSSASFANPFIKTTNEVGTFSANSYVNFPHTCQNDQKATLPTKTKPPTNWMTTPATTSVTSSYKSDYFLPQFSNPPTTFNNTYFTSSVPAVYNTNDHLNIAGHQEFGRKTSDIYGSSYQEDNQFSWSPSKMPSFMDTNYSSSFAPTTLPTLVGDLALNNTVPGPDLKKESRKRKADFLSVSQLVEPSQEPMAAKVSSRRNSGTRAKVSLAPKLKRTTGRSESVYQKSEKTVAVASVGSGSASAGCRATHSKNVPNSYSAEALIGSDSSEKRSSNILSCQGSKNVMPNYFNENMMPYFPSVEVSQENTYLHSNQGFQSNTFAQNFSTTFQNNIYNSNNFIPTSSSYISSNSFMPNTQDYLGENNNFFHNSNPTHLIATKERCNKTLYRISEKEEKQQSYSCRKAKKRNINENVSHSFDAPFFPMSTAVNSPILTDDYHKSYLPATTLYSCKNPLYTKPTPDLLPPPPSAISGGKASMQLPQISPSVNPSSGTSLTNFNLSTIFPEMNKGSVEETFSAIRNKDCSAASKNFSVPPSLQENKLEESLNKIAKSLQWQK